MLPPQFWPSLAREGPKPPGSGGAHPLRPLGYVPELKTNYDIYLPRYTTSFAILSPPSRHRNHRVLVVSALVQAALLALMPELTRLHRYSFIVLRILQGAAAVSSTPIRQFYSAGEDRSPTKKHFTILPMQT